ncbi:uncharacterized protein LOC105174003 [Sesamum indicum]|uniref:Uncharacterized protein LOC105174003 n=1 Tax=Sesamum indicum TaxID=4182 RepID=A0A6I9U956_SESIN|nr:uncharacterized protein LOC105174003 [Sesamum indicum]
MDAVDAPPHSKVRPLLRRWKSISTSVVALPTNLSAYSSSTSDDLQLLSIKPVPHSYSSLKDILPSSVAVNSPQPKAAQPGPDICIRNRLVKQAAWAYLQPMSTSLGSTGDNFFHHLWTRVASAIDFVVRNVVRALDGTLRVIRIRSSTSQRSNMCFL